MIGFTELGDTAEADPDSGLQKRRVFYLLPHDRDAEPEGLYRGRAGRGRGSADDRTPAGRPEDRAVAARAVHADGCLMPAFV